MHLILGKYPLRPKVIEGCQKLTRPKKTEMNRSENMDLDTDPNKSDIDPKSDLTRNSTYEPEPLAT